MRPHDPLKEVLERKGGRRGTLPVKPIYTFHFAKTVEALICIELNIYLVNMKGCFGAVKT